MAAPTLARGVLLDLDGTLLDTAPDLVDSLNKLRAEQGLSAIDGRRLAPVVASGSPALIQQAFGPRLSAQRYTALQERFLAIYRGRLAYRTRPYPGMLELLAELEATGRAWGVVTNKPRWLTQPLLAAMGLDERAGCVIAGDDTDRPKPHPGGIRLACRQLGLAPHDCVMVGDHARDIEAGLRAGSLTLVALFGYLSAGDRVAHWGADGLIDQPGAIQRWLAPASPGQLNATA
jgi:phosphoglycolate phosphatase